MAPRSSTSTDKNIVDRTKAHRNSEVARAIRKTRDQLSQNPGNPVFDRELLKHHAHAMISSATAIPLLVMVIATGGVFAGLGAEVRVWALLAVTCYMGLGYFAYRVDRGDGEKLDVEKTRRWFLVAHFVSGLGWAYFAAMDCSACEVEQFPIIKAVILLIAIAATAIIA